VTPGAIRAMDPTPAHPRMDPTETLMEPRPAHEVMREIRRRLSDAGLGALRDDDLAYALQTRGAQASAEVPTDLLEEYALARLGEQFPAAEPRLVERRRAVQRRRAPRA
jgi:hypothetical protein